MPLRGVLTEAGRELLGSDGDGAAPDAFRDALVDEHLEVAPDRHLAHVELGCELGDEDVSVGVETLAHELESVERLDVHPATRRVREGRADRPVT